MTNEELRQAIEDAYKLARATAPDAAWYGDAVKHLRALLVEQERRAVAQQSLGATPYQAVQQWPQVALAVSTCPVPGAAMNPPWAATCKVGGYE